MLQSTYVLKTLLVYGFVFFLSFYAVKLFHTLKLSKSHSRWLVTALLAFISSGTVLMVTKLDMVGIPDAKFYLAGFTTYFFGVLPGLAVSVAAITAKYLGDHSDPVKLSIMFAVIHLLYYLVRRIREKYELKENFLFFSALSLVSSTSVLLTAAMMFGTLSEFGLILSNSVIASLLGMIFLSALSTMLCDERAMYQSIDELKRNYSELVISKDSMEFLAVHEPQTGFFNVEKLNQEVAHWHKTNQSNPMQLLIIGIANREGLKQMLGNVLFDITHFAVGAEIKDMADRYYDNVFCSLDKGKYALLIKNQNDAALLESHILELNENLSTTLLVHGIDIRLSTVIGGVNIAECGLVLNSEKNDHPAKWIDFAESAFMKAEAGGGDGQSKILWFEEFIYEEQKKHASLLKALILAIKEEEFSVVYQPQYDNAGGLAGAEALVRWHNPEHGVVSPDLFIPLAEAHGVIDEIDTQVLHRVCQFIQENLMAEGSDAHIVPISVNVSFLELISVGYSDRLKKILATYNVDSQWLRLEVTETAVSSQYNDVIASLKRLEDEGFYISLDDFGTGYSSLNHLGRMPVKCIKIDKSFIDQILDDHKIAEIVSLAISFAHRFDMEVVAEGVEEEAQVEWLKENNCNKYQGYYFSKPLSPEAFLKALAKNQGLA